MRSVPAGSFARLCSFPALWRAWRAVRRHKGRHANIAAFDLDADRHLLRLHRELLAGDYRPRPYRLSVVRDPKTRLIAAPTIRDRVVQQALLMELAPTWERGFSAAHFAWGSGRGPHRAALRYLHWLRRTRWRLGLDIRHYFASVDLARLYGLFAHRLRDARTLALVEQLLGAGAAVYQTPRARRVQGPVPAGHGLPLGGYLSHWCGGLYLDGLDHHVQRTLKVPGYLRYMDDFVLFGDDPAALAARRAALAEWLAVRRGLLLKDPAAPLVPNTQPGTFLGLRISRAGCLPGPKMKRRLRQRLTDPGLATARLARGLCAYRGVLAPF